MDFLYDFELAGLEDNTVFDIEGAKNWVLTAKNCINANPRKILTALSALQKATECNPNNIEIYEIYADIYISFLKNNELAQKNIAIWLLLAPYDDIAYYALFMLADNNNDLHRAQQFIEHCISLRPNFAPYHSDLAYVLIKTKDYKNALVSLHKSITLDVHFIKSYHLLADIYCRLTRPSSAIDVLSQGLKNNPNNVGLTLKLSQQYFNTHQYDLAINILTAFLQQHPDDPLMYQLRGNCYLTYNTDEMTCLAFNDFLSAVEGNYRTGEFEEILKKYRIHEIYRIIMSATDDEIGIRLLNNILHSNSPLSQRFSLHYHHFFGATEHAILRNKMVEDLNHLKRSIKKNILNEKNAIAALNIPAFKGEENGGTELQPLNRGLRS